MDETLSIVILPNWYYYTSQMSVPLPGTHPRDPVTPRLGDPWFGRRNIPGGPKDLLSGSGLLSAARHQAPAKRLVAATGSLLPALRDVHVRGVTGCNADGIQSAARNVRAVATDLRVLGAGRAALRRQSPDARRAHQVLAEVAFLVTTFVYPEHSHLVPPTATFVSKALTVSMTMVCTLLVPIVFVCFVTNSGVARCQRLLLLLVDAEVIIGEDMNSPPYLIRRPLVVIIMIILGATTCAQMYFQCDFWNDHILQTVFEVWVMVLLLAVVYLFFSLALMMKFYFEVTNNKLLLIVNELNREFTEKQESKPSEDNDASKDRANPDSERPDTAPVSLLAIREAHFASVQACEVIQGMFSAVLLVFYVHVLIVMLACLYFTVLSSQMNLSAFEEVFLGATAAGTAVLGGVVAWAAGSAKETGSARAAALSVAVLVAAARCARPAVEAEAQVFLLQLRARPPCFHAGGVFPVDLRFFVSLLGTIVGYVSVVVQFAIPEYPHLGPLCTTDNITKFCISYLKE